MNSKSWNLEKPMNQCSPRPPGFLLPSALNIPYGLTILQLVGIAALSLAIVLITRKP